MDLFRLLNLSSIIHVSPRECYNSDIVLMLDRSRLCKFMLLFFGCLMVDAFVLCVLLKNNLYLR